MNISLKYIILIIFIIQFVLGRLQILLAQRNIVQGDIKAKWTSLLMSISRVGTMICAYIELLLRNSNINLVISGLGIGLFLIVIIVKQWAIHSLGQYWSRHIEIRKNQLVILRGPYKFVRHPSYLMNILELIAIPVVIEFNRNS